jgi:hypothetical protein
MDAKKTKWFLLSVLIAVTWVILAVAVSAQGPELVVEPDRLRADLGGTVSIYVTGTLTFTSTDVVRLVGHGILPTTYVNATALQAEIPAGLDVGRYTLRVQDEAGDVKGTGSVRLVASPSPTETPKPESPPPSGQPILTIRNYSVTPLQVRPGQQFTVTVEVYNNGSRAGENTMAVVPGGTFLPVGNNGHMFGQVHINHTFVVVQRMRVPSGTPNGVQSLQVNLSANDYEGNHYEFPQSISVEVVGGSSGSGSYSGKPQVLIEAVSTDPPVIVPGTPFTMTLRLTNRGNRSAVNVLAQADTEVVIPTQGGGVAAISAIRIDETVTMTLPLLLKPGKEGGRQGLAITVEYGDYGGGGYSDQQMVGVTIDSSLANQPQLLIDSYHTTPEEVSPGDQFTLTLSLANVGGGDAQRITLALGGEEGDNLGVFVPVKGSNVSFVSSVDAGETTTVTLALLISGDADTKAHNLPVALAYDTAAGTREKDTQQVSLMVRRRPEFKISFYRPVDGMAMVGQPFQLPIELINASSARFVVSELEATGDRLEFLEEPSTYVGALDSGGSWTLDTMVLAMEPGPVDVIVNAYYVDDLNQTRVFSQVLSINVIEMPGMMDEEGGGNGFLDQEPVQPPSFWDLVLRFFKGLLGLGS